MRMQTVSCGRQHGGFSKIAVSLPYDKLPPSVRVQRAPGQHVTEILAHQCMFTAAAFGLAQLQEQPGCPPIEEWTKIINAVFTMALFEP